MIFFLSSTKRISYRIKVEVERSPSVHCHKEKLDDVCATEYKETEVDRIFSTTLGVGPEIGT